MKKQLTEILRYGFWGAVSTGINLSLFYIFVFMHLQYVAANVVSYVVAVFVSYYFNKRFVFTNPAEKSVWMLIKYVLIRTISIAADSGLLVFLHERLNIDIALAKLLDSALIISLTFIFSKFWVFSNSRKRGCELS